MSIAAILLAAGDSRRFGNADKIAAPLHGAPLGRHAARSLLTLRLGANYVVTRTGSLDWPGFVTIVNDRPDAGMARSVGLGVAAVRAGGATAVLIALSDMPFVPPSHFARLVARHRDVGGIVASTDGLRRSPPALFGAAWFDTLESLEGDRGAGALLDHAELLSLPPEHLLDIDRPEDLVAASTRDPAWAGPDAAQDGVGSSPGADPAGGARR